MRCMHVETEPALKKLNTKHQLQILKIPVAQKTFQKFYIEAIIRNPKRYVFRLQVGIRVWASCFSKATRKDSTPRVRIPRA